MQINHPIFKTLSTIIFVLTLAISAGSTGTPVHAQSAAEELSSEERVGLQFMIEEEKLARDVYLTLGAQWNLRIFENISRAEQQHMDAVASLLTQYDLGNPIMGNEIGVFVDLELQALYNQLIDEGSQSLVAALLVGAAIEEIDILDLQASMAQTDNPAILRVYTNLRQGSENHLRAFVANWERRSGEVYSPQTMSQADYDEIMTVAPGRGGRGKRAGNGR